MTDTTQPDQQVEPDEDPRRDALRCIQCEFRADDSPGGWYEASEHRTSTGHRVDRVTPLDREPLTGSQPDPLATRKPLTKADAPGGQGPASLYVGPDPQTGDLAVLFKEADGTLTFVDNYPREALAQVSTAARAWRDHLAATLPHVPTEEGQP